MTKFFTIEDLQEVAEDYDDARTLVQVTEKAQGHYVLECVQYYCRDGVCRLEITAPLDWALRVFQAALAQDAAEYVRHVRG